MTSKRQTEGKPTGTIGLENKLLQNEGYVRYNDIGKTVLSYKEVLANILKYGVPEYADYTCQEIIGFIDEDSISKDTEIKPDSDSRVAMDDTVQTSIGDANLTFDIKFKVRKPEEKRVHLHVDVELQGKYNPGYPLEKRGIYHLSRMISSQLDVINERTDYGKLEKACCIFVCVGRVPKYLQNTISYYGFSNKRNIGKIKTDTEKYDLMDLILIRIGETIPDKVSELIRFLHGIFYDIEEVKDYIDFSKNEKLRKEVADMSINGEHLVDYGMHLEQKRTKKILKEKDAELAQMGKIIEDKDKELEEKDKELKEALNDKEKVLKEQEQEIERIRKLLEGKK